VLERLNYVVVEAIEKAVTEVGKYDADDWFVIAITVSARTLCISGYPNARPGRKLSAIRGDSRSLNKSYET